MNINLTIEKLALEDDDSRIILHVENGLNYLRAWDLLDINAIEELETDLTNIVQKLYDYRKSLENKS